MAVDEAEKCKCNHQQENLWKLKEELKIIYVICIPLTMCDSFSATCHNAITQLDDLGNADNLLGVVAFIRQQHQEEKDVGNDGL